MIEAILTPTHTHSFESLLDKPLTGALHDATPDRQSQFLEPSVVDVLSMLIEVVVQIRQRFVRRGWQPVQVKGRLDISQHLTGFSPSQFATSLGKPLHEPARVRPSSQALAPFHKFWAAW